MEKWPDVAIEKTTTKNPITLVVVVELGRSLFEHSTRSAAVGLNTSVI